ncbi:MAG: hypothetical protein L3J46_09435 [Kangiellaceae bacterium]|nr:hypothetical protein [Kangiellaceae bacterium]
MNKRIIYVKLHCNKVELKNISSGESIEIRSEIPLNNSRIVLSEFSVLEKMLQSGYLELVGNVKALFSLAPWVVIHPVNLKQSLCETEEIALRQVTKEAGASHAFVWTGKELSDEEVIKLLK